MQQPPKLLLLVAITATMASPVSAAPRKDGAFLTSKYSCRNCHVIAGEGSLLAPPLDGIGKVRTHSSLFQRLIGSGAPKKAADYPLPESLMSHVKVPEADAKIIAAYLVQLPKGKLNATGHGSVENVPPQAPAGSQFVPQTKSASSQRGLMLYKEMGCAACHAIENVGGTAAPDLAGIGARRSRNFIESRISKGATFLPKPGQASKGYVMPPSKLTESQVKDITNWLLTLPASKK